MILVELGEVFFMNVKLDRIHEIREEI